MRPVILGAGRTNKTVKKWPGITKNESHSRATDGLSRPRGLVATLADSTVGRCGQCSTTEQAACERSTPSALP